MPNGPPNPWSESNSPSLRQNQGGSHLGGITTWNDAEDIWECPLHGSCFDSGGSVLWGPATEPLDRLPADGAR
ncbi:putative iron-sulfur binding oxidoreductase [Mycobacteroides abscessus subsp. abscessus]|nr:putative iron-sulfur binding oxidoreductase [Mycobacteroides abscessus subsp. abscessus]